MKLSFREKVISSFIDLSSFPINNITAKSPLYWIKQKKYSDWGPSMVLHPNTREYYKEGCEFIDDEVLKNIVNCNLVENNVEQKTEEICLYKTRLLHYLGIYESTKIDLEKLRDTKNVEIKDWAEYLINLEKYVLNPAEFKLSKQNLEKFENNNVLYLMKFLLMNSYSQNLKEKNILNFFEEEISHWPKLNSLNSIVFEARKLRYQASFLFSSERFKELLDMDKLIDNLVNKSLYQDFLEIEAIRRLLFYFCSRLCLIKDFECAYKFIQNLVKIDPYCSAVQTLKGIIEENLGIFSLAKASYQVGYSLGYAEKQFCHTKINKIEEQNITKNNINKEIENLWSANIKYKASKINNNDLLNLIKNSSVFEMYPAFWTFSEDDRDNKPFWYKQTKNAFSVLKSEKDLFFETCYFQSLQPYNFRYKMTLSAIQESEELKKFEIDNLQNFSIMNIHSSCEQIEFLQNSLNAVTTNSKHACYISRVFLYLGLEQDAVKATAWIWSLEKWDIYHCYLAYTSLLLSYRSGIDLNYYENSQIAFFKFPDCDETLRLRLMLCIQCGGFYGKKKDIAKVKYWYHNGKSILDKILESDKFKNEEKMILHSRWYRFTSFIPYLEKNNSLLNKETNLYISLSTEVLEHSPSKFTLENMYAVYETRARTAEFLCQKEEAYNWFLKIRNDVDPFDSKVEINLGDMKEKIGDLDMAYFHFEMAYKKGPPLRDMALFKMARIDRIRQRNWQSLFLFSRYQELIPSSKLAEQYISDIFLDLNDERSHLDKQIKFGSDDFVSYLNKSFIENKFFYENKKLNIELLTNEIGTSHPEVLKNVNDSKFSAKAMKWIDGTPTAFRVKNGSAAEVMMEDCFLILLQKPNCSLIINNTREMIANKLNINLEWVDYKVSLSNSGAGVGLHFDRSDTFQIHVFGKKSWNICLNSNIHYPLSSYAQGTEIDSELLSYISENDLKELPKLDHFELNPGDCFFVEAGMWHSTLAYEPSCTISFQIKIPVFINFVTSDLLRKQLIKQPQWRHKTYGLWEEGCLNERGRQRLKNLANFSNINVKEINFNYPS